MLQTFMKQAFSFLLTFCLSIAILSCNENDDVSDIVVGSWTIYSAEFTGCLDMGSNVKSTYFCTPENCTRYIFMPDGTLKSDRQSLGITTIVEGTYSIAGNSLTITLNGIITTYTFKVSENNLSLATPGINNCLYTSFWSK
jgi:hypothetical protein